MLGGGRRSVAVGAADPGRAGHHHRGLAHPRGGSPVAGRRAAIVAARQAVPLRVGFRC